MKKKFDIKEINFVESKWVMNKYLDFYKSQGYIPKYFDVYNGIEIDDIAPTISTRSNGAMGSGTLLVIQEK